MINLSELLTGKVDETLNGISNYIQARAESLTSGFVRNFTFSNEEKMTFINDVYIDLCFGISDNNNKTTPTHNLDNGVIIAETVKKEPTIWTLDCKLTSSDHREKYEKLLKMDLVTLMFRGEVKENLVVTSINRKITNAHYTDFTINLAKLNFVTIQTIPAPDFKKITSKPVQSVAEKKETDKVLSTETVTPADAPFSDEYYKTKETENKIINVVTPFNPPWDRNRGGAF